MKEHNGRYIKCLIWLDSEGNEVSRTLKKGEIMICFNEFHGEYDMDWACLFVDGEEKERFNMKHVTQIIWMDSTEEAIVNARQ